MTEERFSFLSSDKKTWIDAVKWLPDNKEYHTILQISHGMQEHIDRYRGFAEFLTARGFLVAGHTHLGHGKSVASQDDWGYIADSAPGYKMVSDMHRLRTLVQRENKNIPYFMLAHSMGSYLLRRYITIYHRGLAGVIIVGTGCVEDAVSKTGMAVCKLMAKIFVWRHRSALMERLVFCGPYDRFDKTGRIPEKSWLTKDTECVRTYYADPACTFRFTLNGYFTLMQTAYYDTRPEYLKKIPKSLPLLLISGKDDPVGNMGRGVKKVYRAYQKAGIKDVTCKLYKNDRHELLNETDKETVYEDVVSWISAHMHV